MGEVLLLTPGEVGCRSKRPIELLQAEGHMAQELMKAAMVIASGFDPPDERARLTSPLAAADSRKVLAWLPVAATAAS